MRVLTTTAKKKDGDFNEGSVQLIAPTPTKNDDLLAGQRYPLRQPSKTGRFSVDIAGYSARPVNELVAARWPSWIVSVAGEVVKGLLPRQVESFEKLEKAGFANMDPESVRLMAREIIILQRLDHPNVVKLLCVITSRMSSSLYLVFEYMDHDLARLAATPGIKFTELQIKCYMQKLFRGLEHCHSRGVLTETSKVGIFWAPELLLGANRYGVAIDMWSAGCILAELFAGKLVLPGRTEEEQMHRIFKLCGSPSEEYWQKTKLTNATSFKPRQPYKRCVADTFRNFPQSALSLVDKLLSMKPDVLGSATSALRSELDRWLNHQFFTTELLHCNPIGSYPPTKEKMLNSFMRKQEGKDQRLSRGGELNW
ncbi:Hydroxysteroid 11-beta-dehydrogenase 1-like protein isoform 1 [Hibiscus syriacus]|uniref:Hydroxysteroid 11-beta-dehydrogenase 1-like protein isoform 1 n=1 Tax=Hibiscus syriacus TaxID=106335 RepID=A0A6A2YRY9_HIBSY|nr:Hydroxysteroid 11-beta-dehydrogenase 1-like protein isoform 1 [Hibiscus syriacus]